MPQLLLMFSRDVAAVDAAAAAAVASAGRTQLVQLKENCEMFTNPLSGCRLVSGLLVTQETSRPIGQEIHMYFYMRLYRQLYIHLLICSYDLQCTSKEGANQTIYSAFIVCPSHCPSHLRESAVKCVFSFMFVSLFKQFCTIYLFIL